MLFSCVHYFFFNHSYCSFRNAAPCFQLKFSPKCFYLLNCISTGWLNASVSAAALLATQFREHKNFIHFCHWRLKRIRSHAHFELHFCNQQRCLYSAFEVSRCKTCRASSWPLVAGSSAASAVLQPNRPERGGGGLFLFYSIKLFPFTWCLYELTNV